ncbi:hypothetical protein [Flammeovirga aprica]|uniref:Uncharacterized protein n=1 Tax=Flammeovirga aprica JL-4 TaxID=694437 RepID=A0A7X9P2Y5_9BACT|nr:hypothetical protein [Flammeovirga aprica]NME68591.1 hypothetical protein [Flammeovirga aprica JL-4]
MKEYRINKQKISDYTKRNDNRVFKILLFTMLGMPILMYPSMGKSLEPFLIMSFSLLTTALIVGLIYLNNKKLTRLSAENLRILIDENTITRVIDLEHEPRMNFLHKYSYQQGKTNSGAFYTKIEFKNLKSVSNKNGDLWVHSIKSNSFNGHGILVIPQELENFMELEQLLRSTTNQMSISS